MRTSSVHVFLLVVVYVFSGRGCLQQRVANEL